MAWRNDGRSQRHRLSDRNRNLRCDFHRRGARANQGKKFHPFLYWLTIVATTTVGTTLADYCAGSLGIGYTGGSTILLICVIGSLLIWRWSTGSISIETVNTPKVEVFYWVTIMFSQTLGTALGDWVADTNEMGYLGAAAVFGGLLLVTALLYYFTSLSRVILFWAAFILTRPLGAVVGDFSINRSHKEGWL